MSGVAVSGGASGRLRCAPVPWEQFVQPGSRMIGNTGQHVGEPGAWIDIVEPRRGDQRYIAAALLPPRSLPANSQLFRPRATTRPFCPCRARAGSPLPVAPLFPAQSSYSARRAKGHRPVCAGRGTNRHRHFYRRLEVRSCLVCGDGSGRAFLSVRLSHQEGSAAGLFHALN